jgi:4-amino-4-deoxy-L-arabinose transferase-like glycosyltransferase
LRGWEASRSGFSRFVALSLAVGLLTILAGAVRVWGLPEPEGTFGRDEARLAMAANGILQYGVPRLPGGLVYTRGLLPAYLEAGAFALFGVSDDSARIQSLVAGTLLVPLVYGLARTAVGPAGALAAAAVVAFNAPLVLQAREAWLYSTFLPLFTLALILVHRGYSGGSGPAQVGAAAAFAGALFCHELAVMLLPILGSFLLIPAGPPRSVWWRGRWTIAAFAIMLLALAVIAALSLSLRAPTLGGPLVEIREYLNPTSGLKVAGSYLQSLDRWHATLLPLAVLGLPIVTRWLSHGALLLYVALGWTLLVPSFLLLSHADSRYVMPALMPLTSVAAFAAARWGPRVIEALAGDRLSPKFRNGVSALLPFALLLPPTSWSAIARDAQVRNVPSTWVQAMPERQPSDLVLSFAPTLTSHYLGRTDFWLRSRDYEKYVWASGRPLRDIHSNAVLVRNQRELEQFVLRPYAGQTAWAILDSSLYATPPGETLDLVNALRLGADIERMAPDGRMVIRIRALGAATAE